MRILQESRLSVSQLIAVKHLIFQTLKVIYDSLNTSVLSLWTLTVSNRQ